MRILKDFWLYLGESQPKWTRYIHVTLAVLILSQIIHSNFMIIEYVPKRYLSLGTWFHICSGFTTLVVSVLFISIVLSRHSLKYFFPYLYGEFAQLKSDINTLMRFKLPELSPYGIAPIVQGLGLGALVLVLISGCFWLISWLLQWNIAFFLQETHEFLTGFIPRFQFKVRQILIPYQKLD